MSGNVDGEQALWMWWRRIPPIPIIPPPDGEGNLSGCFTGGNLSSVTGGDFYIFGPFLPLLSLICSGLWLTDYWPIDDWLQDTANYSCVAANIGWSIDGLIIDGLIIDAGHLLVLQAQLEDIANYSCVAANIG